MNLIIDIGNTRAKLLVFEGDNIIEKTYSDSETLQGVDDVTRRYAFEKGIISTVAKLGEEAERRLLGLPFPLIRLNASTALPVQLRWRSLSSKESQPLPNTMGADRIAALVGAKVAYPHTPLLIIDAGTCVTYEVIDGEGYYLGGNIAPGLRLRLASMHDYTALLPLVEQDGEKPVIGKDTETAMRCGAVDGLHYEMEGYIHHWRQQIPDLQVILTGGSNTQFRGIDEDIIHIDSDLVAKGLNAILQQA